MGKGFLFSVISLLGSPHVHHLALLRMCNNVHLPSAISLGSQMIKVPPLSFETILRLHDVDGSNKDGPIVRYEVLNEPFLATLRGVYLVTQNDEIVYCGKFTNTFAKRWLYTRGRYVYHFKRNVISEAILKHKKIEVHAQTEDILRSQIGQTGNDWISATSIEEKLIRDLRPVWNLVRLSQESD